MTDTTIERSASASGAGVLELLRLFRSHEAAADGYAAVCLERAKAVEPLVKAFEYLPVDTARRPGPLSGIPVAIKNIIATADMPTTNGSPVRGIAPKLGLRPMTPLNAAGRMTEPSVCVPSASGTIPAATAAADPEDDPPGV